jgi:hypothetical protein
VIERSSDGIVQLVDGNQAIARLGDCPIYIARSPITRSRDDIARSRDRAIAR